MYMCAFCVFICARETYICVLIQVRMRIVDSLFYASFISISICYLPSDLDEINIQARISGSLSIHLGLNISFSCKNMIS